LFDRGAVVAGAVVDEFEFDDRLDNEGTREAVDDEPLEGAESGVARGCVTEGGA
jgi:hypothetical protein